MSRRKRKNHYKQGLYRPKNPQKYRGDISNIFLRSGWEISVARWLDNNPSVLDWSCEEVVIPYLCETDGRSHRYFVDFSATIKDVQGNIQKYLIEVKPYAETQVPKVPKRRTKNYERAVLTFMKNQSKWKYAREYANRIGAKFVILTEKEIYGKG